MRIKSVKEGYNDCTFMAADKVWWNIADMNDPILSLKEKITAVNVETIKENVKSLESDKVS